MENWRYIFALALSCVTDKDCPQGEECDKGSYECARKKCYPFLGICPAGFTCSFDHLECVMAENTKFPDQPISQFALVKTSPAVISVFCT